MTLKANKTKYFTELFCGMIPFYYLCIQSKT